MVRDVLAPLAVAVCLAGGGPLAAQQLRGPGMGVPFITVEGQASREVAPDLAVVSLGITTDRATAADAAAQNNKTAAALINEIKAAGITDADIATTQLTLTPLTEPVRQGSDATRIKGFRASNIVEIRTKTIPMVGDLVGKLVDKGANTLQGIDFTLSNPQPLLDGLRADATRDARRKAEIFAGAAGVKLGRVLEIQPEGAPVPFDRRAKSASIMAAAPVAAAPIQAGTQILDARVSVTWELVP